MNKKLNKKSDKSLKFPLLFHLFIFSVVSGITSCVWKDLNFHSPSSSLSTKVESEFFTPIVMYVLAAPIPVKGSDGVYHLVYNLIVNNANNSPWQISSIEILSADSVEQQDQNYVFASLTGDEVTEKMQLLGARTPTNKLEPGQGGVVFIDFTIKNKEQIPSTIKHMITLTVPGGIPPQLAHLLELKSNELTEIGGFTEVVLENPVVLGVPLEGVGWVAANGCCDSLHVRALLPINGGIHLTQRFAIDWVKLNEENRLFIGNINNVNSFFGYGQKVLAVADARVVTVVDKFKDQIPGEISTDNITFAEIDGNHIVLDLGNGQYAFYAHLKPKSIKFKEGDYVKKGDVIALLGNSGNTSAPHLHFHVISSPLILGSNGLPYVLDKFNLVGSTTQEALDEGMEDHTPFDGEKNGEIVEGTPLKVIKASNPGTHKNELPLNLSIVTFPDSKK
ncbi:MAG TPA: M23 family metallopeptidase [Thermodesulfobacteriota bacterium]